MGNISSLFGSNQNNVPVNTFQMPGMTQSAGQTTGGIQQMDTTLQSLLQQYMPQMNAQTGANTAGGQAGALAATSSMPGATAIGQGSMQGAQNLQGGAEAMLPYAAQTLQTAFDPQSQLYDKMFQQNQDMARANNSASGVGTTPYGAGVADQSSQNFNIDWANQQLGRQATGASTAEGILSGAGNTLTGAQPLGNAGQAGLVQSAMLPYATTAAGAGANTQALQGGIGATTTASQPTIQDLLAYLGAGNQSNSIYNQGQIGGTNATTAQNNSGWGELGNLLGAGFGLAGKFASGGFGGSGGGQ